MPRDHDGELIDIKRQIRSILTRLEQIEKHQQLFTMWMDSTQFKLDEVNASHVNMLLEMAGVCDQVERLCDAFCGDDEVDGELVN